MPKPSVIIDSRGRRHTGSRNRRGEWQCSVARRDGWCAYCSRVTTRMPEADESPGSPQRVDIPFRTDGERILNFVSCRSDLVRLSWEVERYTPMVVGLAFRDRVQDPVIRSAACAAGVAVPDLPTIQRRMAQLRQQVRQKLLDMDAFRRAHNGIERESPRTPDDSSGVLSSLEPAS